MVSARTTPLVQRTLLLAVGMVFMAVAVSAEEFYSSGSGVIELKSSNFASIVNKPGTVTIVEFFAPWCGHCKALKPEYVKAAKALQGLVQVAALDCDVEENKPMAGQYGIRGFPTIKAFVGGSSSPQEYQGERTAKAIVEWAKGLIPSNVELVTKKNHAKFLDKSKEQPRVLLFTDKTGIAPLYKSLSNQFKGHMVFGQIHKGEKELLEQYSVGSFPTIMVLPPNGAASVLYEGKVAAKQLAKFLRRFTLDKDGNQLVPGGENDYLPQLHDESCLKMHCVDKGALCAILIIEGSQAESDAMDAMLAVRDAREDALYSFAWIDINTQGAFLQEAFGVAPQPYPQLVVLSAKKKRFAPFIGTLSEENVATFLNQVLRGSVKTQPLHSTELPKLAGETQKCVERPKAKPKPQASTESGAGGEDGDDSSSVILTDKNFEELVMQSTSAWMVEFYAPWCGHCKNLAPEWAKAAKNVKGMVKFGQVDATAETKLAARFGIQGYPTIKIFGGGAKSDSTARDYENGRSAKALSDYALGLLTDDHVARLGSAEFAGWFSTRPSLRRAVFFTEKQETPAMVKALSMEFQDRLAFAVVQKSEEQLAQQFRVESFPALVVTDAPANADPEKGGVTSQRYDGKFKYSLLVNFLKQLAGAKAAPADSAPAAPTGPQIAVVRDHKDFEEHCLNKLGLCGVIFVSPDIMPKSVDETSTDETAAMLYNIAKANAKKPIHFAVIDREAQRTFFNVWGLADDSPISVVLLNSRKKRSAKYVGVPDQEHITDFIDGVLSGRERTTTLKEFAPLKSAAKDEL